MAINILPILIFGSAIALIGKSKKRKFSKEKLAIDAGRGTICEGDTEDRPSGMRLIVGERFSITFDTNPTVPGSWKLQAIPPDNSVEFVRTEYDSVGNAYTSPEAGSPSGKDIYIFQ